MHTGQVSERSKETVLKTVERKLRGFESRPVRHSLLEEARKSPQLSQETDATRSSSWGFPCFLVSLSPCLLICLCPLACRLSLSYRQSIAELSQIYRAQSCIISRVVVLVVALITLITAAAASAIA